MLLVVTGGGTGGHVYPALEVARLARERGDDLLYMGSLRGQEGAACEREGDPCGPEEAVFLCEVVALALVGRVADPNVPDRAVWLSDWAGLG